jgi:hypothetical protein
VAAVPTLVTIVDDSEDLIRRIPADSNCYDSSDGTLRFSSTAFNDRDHMPSVDRRKLKASLNDCKNHPTDGLLLLIANEVRAIKLPQTDQKGKPTSDTHKIDVMHRPIDADNAWGLPANEAHSQVESTPILSESRFKKLKEALARIAEKRGWLASPVSS